MRKRRNPFEAPRRRRFPMMALISVGATCLVILSGVALIVFWHTQSTHAADADQQVNMDCTLIVPPNPLTAKGLATPYQLVATNPDNGPCNESNANQAAFVQGSVFDFATGQVSVYNPLVVDQGTQPALNPVVPNIPAHAVVALWFGFNGNNLTLQSSHNSLRDGRCVNGSRNSIFGQFAYCNAPAYFNQVNQAIKLGTVTPPALGTGKDGKPCMSVRDFGLVDQDQSDNVTTGYLVTKDGRIAQLTATNQQQLPNAQVMDNGSDNGLLDAFVDPALGCTPWMAPDLANPGHMATALPLNELQAMTGQQQPVALVPLNDPMVLNNNNNDLNKTNLYRLGVDQPRAQNNDQASGKTYCQNFTTVGAPRIVADAPLTAAMTTPDAATGNNLFTFLAQRFVNSYMNLNCQKLTGQADPIATSQDGNGAAISATFNGQPINTTGNGNGGNGNGGNGNGGNGGAGTPPDCQFNGQTVKGCNGTVNVNGQTCKLSVANNTVAITCHRRNQ